MLYEQYMIWNTTRVWVRSRVLLFDVKRQKNLGDSTLTPNTIEFQLQNQQYLIEMKGRHSRVIYRSTRRPLD